MKKSLKKKVPVSRRKTLRHLDVTSTNISGVVLEVIRENSKRSGLKIDTISDLIRNLLGYKVDREVIINSIQHLIPLVDLEGQRVYPSAELLRSKDTSFFDTRKSTSRRAKRAVAKHIHDNMMSTLGAVFLDGGSACEAVAEEMARGEQSQFTVMTNNRKAVKAFMTNDKIRIHLTGGIYKSDDETFVGQEAVFDTRKFNVKHAIIGVSGLTPTHVFNHDILGEEYIKKQYWQIPAEWLIVPANLRKFEGKDASCFGVLCHAETTHVETGGDVYESMDEAIENKRKAWWNDKYGGDSTEESEIPRFKAEACIIVIEPEWMIDEEFEKEEKELRDVLMSKVEEINSNSRATRVCVVFSDVKRKDLKR
ncbi:Glycerol-3-phosphate regulon repressor [Gimesia aquarii]|uniref:Glycerol-3-phosphate regulon repressor n=2 Tax=Gimesia aquarii TaxID=2527964 RepID=A0A517VPI9_9PLAN|nr:Glycerol-3-phosphate regulon repressor [Gimesia aquarii]